MINLPELVSDYGYYAVAIGSLLEGEAVLLLSGIAAHRGDLSFAVIVAIAFVGGTLGDQILFQIGRMKGQSLLLRRPALAKKVEPVNRLLLKYPRSLVIGVRFMYGLRLVGPFAMGMSRMPSARFAFYNMIGAAIWAPTITGVGYLFGSAVGWLVDDLGHYELIALGTIVAIAASVWFWRNFSARRERERLAH